MKFHQTVNFYQSLTICCLLFQLVVAEVANKFAQSHFGRGVRDTNVRLLTKVVVQYIDRQVSWDKLSYY